MSIFKRDLAKKLSQGGRVKADKGYDGNIKGSAPCDFRAETRKKLASKIRSRQESVNGKLKQFRCLKEVFCHGVSKHNMVFEAVVVLIQLSISFGGEKLWETNY